MWQAALAGYQIIAGFQQAEMVGMQAEMQRQIDEFNAQLAEYDAWKMIGYGQTQMARYQTQLDQAAGSVKAQAAAAGVDITQGSVGEIVAENDLIGRLNLMDIENQAREKSLGYTRQAAQIRLGSKFSQSQSKVQQASIIGGSIMKAAGTYVSGLDTSAPPKSKVGNDSGYSIDNQGSNTNSSVNQKLGTGFDYLIP